MKKLFKLIALTLALCLALLPALAEEATEEAQAPEAAAEETVQQSDTDMMAIVNGKIVARAAVNDIFSNLASYYSQYGYDVSTPEIRDLLTAIALENAVSLELIYQKATELGLDQFNAEEQLALEADAAQQFSELIDSYINYYGGLAEDATEEEKTKVRVDAAAALEAMGYTEDLILESAKENAIYNKVKDEVTKDVAVSDEAVRAAFDEKAAEDEQTYGTDVGNYEFMTQYYGQTSYYVPAGYRGVTHILLIPEGEVLSNYQTLAAKLEEQQNAEEEAVEMPEVSEETSETAPEEAPEETNEEAAEDAADEAVPEEPVTQEQVDAAYAAVIAAVQPTIDEINAKLAEGVTFEELIEQYGQDPGMKSEPNKSNGYSVHMDSILWDPAFVKAAFSVDNVGDIAEPVVGSYGVHIVKYLRDVPAGQVELTDDIKAVISENILSELQSQAFTATLDAWQQEAEIIYSDESVVLMDKLQAASSAAEQDAEEIDVESGDDAEE